jgi:nucleoside-diphosphate-sugar epimerase
MQTRPNIHIDDITELYIFLLDNPQHQGVFNAGFENLSISEIAEMVAAVIPAEIRVTPSNDPRSYRVNSDRLLATGFKPRKKVSDAISEIAGLYRQGSLKNEDHYYNLRWMQRAAAQ